MTGGQPARMGGMGGLGTDWVEGGCGCGRGGWEWQWGLGMGLGCTGVTGDCVRRGETGNLGNGKLSEAGPLSTRTPVPYESWPEKGPCRLVGSPYRCMYRGRYVPLSVVFHSIHIYQDSSRSDELALSP